MKNQINAIATRGPRIVDLAKMQCHKDGECEVDDGAAVSEGNDNGAYVQAWVWVDFEGTDLDKEAVQRESLVTGMGAPNVTLEPVRTVQFENARPHQGWNGIGFERKDPGERRDGNKPCLFDEVYPINADADCKGISRAATVGEVLSRIKKQMPYPVRFRLTPEDAATSICVRGLRKNTETLLKHVARTLGRSWQLMKFSSHFTLYKQNKPKHYANGIQLHP